MASQSGRSGNTSVASVGRTREASGDPKFLQMRSSPLVAENGKDGGAKSLNAIWDDGAADSHVSKSLDASKAGDSSRFWN